MLRDVVGRLRWRACLWGFVTWDLANTMCNIARATHAISRITQDQIFKNPGGRSENVVEGENIELHNVGKNALTTWTRGGRAETRDTHFCHTEFCLLPATMRTSNSKHADVAVAAVSGARRYHQSHTKLTWRYVECGGGLVEP